MIIDPDKIYQRLMDAGNDWSDKHAAADALEETKKVVLAEIMTRQGDKSNAAAETIALSSPEYREHINAMVEARRLANRAKVLYDNLQTLAELRRSQESTRRAEASIR